MNDQASPAEWAGAQRSGQTAPVAERDDALRRELAGRNRLIEEFRTLQAAHERERAALLAQLQVVEQALLGARREAAEHDARAAQLAQQLSALAAQLETQQAEAQALHEQRRQENGWLNSIIVAREQEQAALHASLQQGTAALQQAEAERDALRRELGASVILPRGGVAGRLVRILRFGKRAAGRLTGFNRRRRVRRPNDRPPSAGAPANARPHE